MTVYMNVSVCMRVRAELRGSRITNIRDILNTGENDQKNIKKIKALIISLRYQSEILMLIQTFFIIFIMKQVLSLKNL